MDDALAGVVEAAELRRDARQLLDPAAPEQQHDEVEDRAADDRAEGRLGHRRRGVSSGDGRVGEHAARPSASATIGAGQRPAPRARPRPCRRAGRPGRRPPRSGGRRSSRRAISSFDSVRRPRSRRNSSTRRRWRSSVIVSPTTGRPPARARSATSARSSAIARSFSASISAAARTRSRSSSSRVAAMSASRVSWATFWARARISFASRRASPSVATRSGSAFSRSRRACSASSGPARCAPCGRRASSRPA